jgi:hypothetical protein
MARTQGERKDRTPAPKLTRTFSWDTEHHSPVFKNYTLFPSGHQILLHSSCVFLLLHVYYI